MTSLRRRALHVLAGIILALLLAVPAACVPGKDMLASHSLPDGRILNHLFYGSGHLHQINLDGRIVCDFERDELHRETSRTQGGLSLRTKYDPLSRILSRTSHPLIAHTPTPEGLNKGYRYDANGELARRADAWHGELAFQHDPTGRILGARTVRAGKTPALHEEHGYDPASNILDPWVEKRGFVQHNRVLVFEDKRYQYDEHGRLIEKRTGRHTTLRLRWNREHQLVESTVERNGAQQSSRYEYDALGRRTLRRDTFGETRFIWDGMRLLQEKRGEQNTTYAYQPGSHEPVARIDDTEAAYKLPGTLATVYHFHTHINGAPEELTNEAGQTLWRARYRAWGSLALEEAFEPLPAHDRAEHATRQPIRMQGQYADTETGLYYNTFRYYDPDIGRFVSEDPIGLLGGLNLYQYAPNADAWVDPWGWAAGWAIIRQFPSNVEGARAGHFTVEVIDSAGASLQTHQVSSHDFKNTAIEKANINGQPVHQVRVKLADADAAKRYQRQVLQVDDLGPYCKKNNSCVTHVEKTLKAGGVTMDGGQARYLRNQGFRPIKKGCPG